MIQLDYDYLDRIRRAASLSTKRKSSDLFEGDFRSLQHGRSLEFDDLREYQFGDDVNLIDWKSSSRTGKTLIRRYTAERRMNVMFVGDTGLKMTGDTPDGESKEHIALMTFGIMAYLVGRQGAGYALAYRSERGDYVSSFLTGPAHLEELLYGYKDAIEKSAAREKKHADAGGRAPQGEQGDEAIAELLSRTVSNIPKRMIVIVITDSEGLAAVDERLLRRLTLRNDVCFMKIEDAYLTTSDAYDLGSGLYEDSYLTESAELRRAEERMRENMDRRAAKLMTPSRVFFEPVSREDEIADQVVRLFRRRREA